MYNAEFQRSLRPEYLAWLAETKGIISMPGSDVSGFAMDAQIPLTTTPNSGIPAWMSYYIDPDILRINFAKLKAAEILGDERKVGDWVTTTSVFPIVEFTGSVSSYGDFTNNAMAGMNASFPQRQSYHYQIIVEYGEREVAMVSQAKINLVSEKKEASTRALNQFQNNSYFYGVSGLQNYGLLNDPALPAAIQPGAKAFNSQAHGPWITSGQVTATPNEVYSDIQALFLQLVTQTEGLIELTQHSNLVLAMPPGTEVAITAANSFAVNVRKLLSESFPNIRFEAAVQYSTAAGNEVQMIATDVLGQQTAWCAFTEKQRAHPIVRALSSWAQKVSQGTWGTIIRQPYAIATMLGV